MTVLCGNGDELHLLRVVDDTLGLDQCRIAVRVVVWIVLIIRSDLCRACFRKLAHDLTELLHIICAFL